MGEVWSGGDCCVPLFPRDSVMIPLINCFTSFFCGFVVFSVIGFMAVQAGLPVDKVITSGPGLAFIVYPEAISQLPLSQLWAVMFFLMLIIVGLDTQVIMHATPFISHILSILQTHGLAFYDWDKI